MTRSFSLAGLTILALTGAGATGLWASPAAADPTRILFVGNSYTHGRYTPALNYNAGPGNATGSDLVHDLLCPTLPCTGAEGVAPVVPTSANTPGGSLLGQLAYLQANPAKDYSESRAVRRGRRNLPAIHQGSRARLRRLLIAVSSATLRGYSNNTGERSRRSAADRIRGVLSGHYAGPDFRAAADHDHGQRPERSDTRQPLQLPEGRDGADQRHRCRR
ncbi:MAG: hypothetical protein WDN69_11720 [Aliidongia sp.]